LVCDESIPIKITENELTSKAKSFLGVIAMAGKMLSVAQELGVNRETARVWIRTGELVALSIGKGYRISRADLDEFIRRRRTDYQKRLDKGTGSCAE
jgi:excisionase family DNA binding protein